MRFTQFLLIILSTCAWAQTQTTTYTFQTLDNGPAFGINDRGQVVGLSSQPSNIAPDSYLYSPDGSYRTFSMHNPSIGMEVMGHAVALNSLDQFVGELDFGLDQPTPFYLYQSGDAANVLTAVGVLYQTDSAAYGSPTAVNDAGAVLGVFYGVTNGSKHTGVLVANSVSTIIAFPGAYSTDPHSLNDAGLIVGSYVDSSNETHGFTYQGGRYTRLDVPNTKSTTITGVNNLGQMVGNYVGLLGVTRGFVYSGGKFTTISLPANLAADGTISLMGINEEGQIVGNAGSTPFIATPSYFIGFSSSSAQ